jgi:hypothetical protein
MSNFGIAPLLYSFRYNAGACGYRVVSDKKVEVLYLETEKVIRIVLSRAIPMYFPKHGFD